MNSMPTLPTLAKVRRLYDIANVLTTLGLIRKKTFLAPNHRKMPGYSWAGPSLEEIKKIGKFDDLIMRRLLILVFFRVQMCFARVNPTFTLSTRRRKVLAVWGAWHSLGRHPLAACDRVSTSTRSRGVALDQTPPPPPQSRQRTLDSRGACRLVVLESDGRPLPLLSRLLGILYPHLQPTSPSAREKKAWSLPTVPRPPQYHLEASV